MALNHAMLDTHFACQAGALLPQLLYNVRGASEIGQAAFHVHASGEQLAEARLAE
jgi:hypothetical protein